MPNNYVAIDTEDLKTGMTVITFGKDNKIEDRTQLKTLLPGTRGCRGLHFQTPQNRNVCYLLGGKVYIQC